MDIPVVVRVVRVSGTIKKAEEEIIRRAKELVLRAKMVDGATAEAAMVRDVMRAVERSRDTEDVVMDEAGDDSESD
jgi:ribonuclease P/MRP protein subunit POP5